jgi:hypothetical protein
MFYFKKIASVLASAVMLSSTIGFAAAASYPAPFVTGGLADAAVVYGANAAISDVTAAIDVQQKLGALAVGSVSTDASVSGGEATALFTSSSPLFPNSTMNTVRETITDSELATVLKDGSFDSASSVKYTQKIYPGNNQVEFAKQPADSDDPQLGVAMGTNAQTNYLYNATVTFASNVNFTHSDSTGSDLMLFGQTFTVGAATTTTKLILFKSSEKVYLDSDNPTADVTIDGSVYTVELVSASDTTATVKVTDSAGVTESKEISESSSKKLRGIEVAIDTADETNLKLAATVMVGSSRITVQDGVAVKEGTDDDLIDGTYAQFYNVNGTATTATTALGKIDFQVAANDNQNDAIVPGQSFVDPIFGTIKVDFAGISIPIDSETSREMFTVKNSGNDKMIAEFQSHDGTASKTVTWVYNNSGPQALADSDNDLMVVAEKGLVNQSGYVVLSNDKGGGLYEVTAITNSSSAEASDDSITLKNVFTGESDSYDADTEGTISLTEQGKTYTVTYFGASTSSNSKAMQVRFAYSESAGQDMILFPTIKTSKGAKIAFYQPTTVNPTEWDGTNLLDEIQFPDGDGYTAVDMDAMNASSFTIDGGVNNVSIAAQSALATIGQLTYNFTGATGNSSQIFLVSPEGGNIVRPALIVFEEKDDGSNYEAFIVTLDAGYDGDSAGIGVSDVVRTWGNDGDLGNEIRLESNNDIYQDMDYWGTLYELNKADSDQTTATISYPDDQVEAQLYIAAETASITPGSSGTTGSGQVMIVTDKQVSSVAGRNLFVVGGSCINEVAAKILGSDSPLCAADFTTETTVGAGQYIIKTVTSPYSEDKVAMLVAGYEAAETTAAIAKALEGVATDVGAEVIGPTVG